MESTLTEKKLLLGSKFFSLTVDPTEKGDKKKWRVTSHDSVLIRLKRDANPSTNLERSIFERHS